MCFFSLWVCSIFSADQFILWFPADCKNVTHRYINHHNSPVFSHLSSGFSHSLAGANLSQNLVATSITRRLVVCKCVVWCECNSFVVSIWWRICPIYIFICPCVVAKYADFSYDWDGPDKLVYWRDSMTPT